MDYPREGLDTAFTQPDGTVLKLKIFGSQYYAETRTSAGETVVFDPAGKQYCYAVSGADGSLVSSGVPVKLSTAGKTAESSALPPGRKTLASKEAVKKITSANYKKINEKAAFTARAKTAAAPARTDGPLMSPPSHTTTGSYKGLCIIAQFPDVSGAFTKQQVDDFCNKSGYSDFGNSGSVKEYYYSMSNGQLTFTNLVTAYVTLPHPKSYYNNTSTDAGLCGRALLNDALTALKASSFDFSSVSSDGNGYIYATSVLFAGDDSGAWSYGLWPHRWHLSSSVSVGGGKYVYDYMITNMGTASLAIGTFCHENGHMLCGYSDYYDYGDESNGLGYHCLMAAGNYCNDGKTPGPMSPYLKWKSGWLTPTAITAGAAGSYSVSSSGAPYVMQKNSTEYYLFENRRKTGWNAYLPAEGLAVWHVDQSMDGNEDEQMTPTKHYECSLVQADGRYDLENKYNYGDSGDYFYNSSPNLDLGWWSGVSSGSKLSLVGSIANSMTFSLSSSGSGSHSLTMAVSGSGATSPPEGQTVSVPTGSSQAVSATPAANYQFSSWSATAGVSVASASSASTTVTLTADGTVTASFTKIQRNLIMGVSPSGTGTVTPGSCLVNQGEAFTVTASAAAGYVFGSWSAGGGASVDSAGSATTAATLTADGTLTANFLLSGSVAALTMSVSPSGTGTVTPGSCFVSKDTPVSIAATPAANYQFSSWTASGGASVASASSASTTVTLSAAGAVTAGFTKIQRTLTMSVSPANSGTVTPGSGAVNQGEAVAVTATPAANCQFSSWTVSGGVSVASASSASTTATLTADGTLTANFTKIQRILTMSVSPANSGTVTPGSGVVNQGEAVAVTATPAANYQFSSWTASGGASVANASSASTTVTLSAAGAVTARFIKIQRALTMTVTPSGSGSVTPGSRSVNHGEPFTIIATPAANYQFSSWTASGGASVSGASSATTTATLTADGAITAGFIKTQRTLTMTVNPMFAGSVTPGTGSVSQGEAFAITATPAANYQFGSWSARGGASVADSSKASTTATLTANGTVTANFVKTQLTLTMSVSPANFGSVTPGTGSVSQGEAFAITATPSANCQFSSWSAGGGASVATPSRASTTATLTASGAITANFTKTQRTLRVIVSPAFAGSASPESGFVNQGEPVGITATPADEYVFGSWSANGGASVADPSKASTTVILTADGAITAGFLRKAGAANDFNGDGKSDLVLRDSGGSAVIHYMSGAAVTQSSSPVIGGGETPVAAGDFNGDGHADIITRSADGGAVKIYLMREGAVLSSGVLLEGAAGWKVMAAADFNGDGKTDIVWQHNATAQTVVYLMSGAVCQAWGIIYDGADTGWKVMAAADLNGDGKADIVWRHASSGRVIGYLMDGAAMRSWGVIYDGSDKDWIPCGAGDLDGDGKADIVWRNSSTGVVIAYLMDGLRMRGWSVIYDGSGAKLRVACLGDFNGDGKTDLALRDSSSGDILIYLMDGLSVSSSGRLSGAGGADWDVVCRGEALNAALTMAVSGSGTVTPPPGTVTVPVGEALTITASAASGRVFGGWTATANASIAAASSSVTTVTLSGDATITARFTSVRSAPFDFNGDGKSDLLWRNTSNGFAAIWLMSGARAAGSGVIFDSDKTWAPVGKGDFDGDGKCDILWQRTSSGAAVIWSMSGMTMTGHGTVRESGSSSAALVGDFNGDGKADILWRDTSGAVSMSLMSGASVVSSLTIFEGGSAWIPVSAADFNGDGKADILWRNSSTGSAAIWLMNGLSASESRLIFAGDGGWVPAGAGDFNGDGKADIVWQRGSDGAAAVWLMSELTQLSSGFVYNGGDSGWKVMDCGDYDGDGKADIAWRNERSGEALLYFMDGAGLKGWCVIFQGDSNWTIVR
jgi:M6 family metalloprotease-like protein